MATAYITFGRAGSRGAHGNIEVRDGAPSSSEEIETSGTSQETSGSSIGSGVVCIHCSGNAWVTVGQSPTVTATTGWFVPANVMIDIGTKEGDKVAIMDA